MLRYSLGLAIAVAALAFAADKTAIADILKDAAKFDGKVLTVTGKVHNFKQKTSKAGNPYYNLKLVNKEGEQVSVYGRGKAENELKDDQVVEVTGKFAKEKKVGSVTFKNEIDVAKDPEDKKTADFGIKIKE